MHAYASFDPLFLAMNRRAQEETGGQLGAFGVRCRAPLATELGLAGDGGGLEWRPESVQGGGGWGGRAAAGVRAVE
jgi:hypothetical protein